MGERPLVSVIIPTYNRNEFLKEAIKNVHQQTYSNIELVIVDGPSEIPAKRVLEDVKTDSFTDVVCVRNEEKQGLSRARNIGIELANGEYIAFLDDDDQWESEKVKKQVEKFESSPSNVGLVYTGRVVENEFLPTKEGNVTKEILCDNFIGTPSTVMVQKKALDEIDGFDDALPRMEDWDFYIRMSENWEFRALPEPLTIHNVAEHEQLSDDFELQKKAYPIFLQKFRPTAAEYGKVFERKMIAHVYTQVAFNARLAGLYREATRYMFQAVQLYPFEPIFYGYLIAYSGGEYTLKFAKKLNLYKIVSGLDPR